MRVNNVSKARKDVGPCVRCSTQIQKGDSYKWIKGRFSPRKNYCAEHSPRRSEMTGSDKLSTLYGIQEQIDTFLGTTWGPEDIVSCLNDAAQEAREVGDEYRDAVSNMPENFQNGGKADELNDAADQCDAWADELESVASDIENYDWPEADENGNVKDPEAKNAIDDSMTNQEYFEHLREEARDAAEQASGNLEL